MDVKNAIWYMEFINKQIEACEVVMSCTNYKSEVYKAVKDHYNKIKKDKVRLEDSKVNVDQNFNPGNSD
jgi:hypothetical protein